MLANAFSLSVQLWSFLWDEQHFKDLTLSLLWLLFWGCSFKINQLFHSRLLDIYQFISNTSSWYNC